MVEPQSVAYMAVSQQFMSVNLVLRAVLDQIVEHLFLVQHHANGRKDRNPCQERCIQQVRFQPSVSAVFVSMEKGRNGLLEL